MMIEECNQVIQWTYAYGISKDLVSQNENTKCNNIINQQNNDELWRCYKRKHKRT